MSQDQPGRRSRDRVGWWPPGKLESGRPAARVRRPPVAPRRPPAPASTRKPVDRTAPNGATGPSPGQWSGLVDIHSHVLPGIDDGARDRGESLRMLRMAQAGGITTIVATPHADRCTPDQVATGVAELNRLAASQGIAVAVVTGSEVPLAPDIADRYRAGSLVTLNRSPYLLLELPLHGDWPPYLLEAVYELQLAGLWPVLAHAERYPAVQQDSSIVADLTVRGVLVQLNADSLAGHTGRAARRAAETLLRRRLVHVIASDAHDASSRPPRLQAALERAEDIAGRSYVEWMVSTSAAVLRGGSVNLPEPESPPEPSLLGRLRHRRDQA